MLYTRPLVTPLTRPLTGKVLKQFDPLSNDPYLLFDAETSMLGELESPTLDLDASDPATLEVITATRSGVATFTDQAGVIREAEPNTVRVDHVQGEELTPTKFQRIGYTDLSWSTSNATFTDGGGYDGQVSKVLTATASNGSTDTGVITENGVTYTGSFYIRRVTGSGNLEFAIYGTASPDATPLILETVTSEWQRIDLQFLGKAGGGTVYFGLKLQVSGDAVEIAMPQVEEGTTATDFVPNTTGSPKFIASATYGPRVPMMLIEPSATNLLTYSEDFSTWSPQDVSISTGFASPDGLLNARNVTPNATNTTHLFSSAGLSSDIKTYSVYAKANGYKYFRFNTGSSGNGFAEFDVEAGTVVSTGGTYYSSSSIEDVGGGWFRCSMTLSAGAATKINIAIEDNSRAVSYLADGVSGLLFWGAQIEEGVVSTSYIPTSGSAVTRNADNLVIDGTAFSDFYNGSEGTFYIESVTRKSDGQPFLAEVDNGTNDRIFIYNDGANVRAFVKTAGATQANFAIGSRPAAGTLNRTAVSYQTNNLLGSVNGGSVTTDTSATMPTSVNTLTIGSNYELADFYRLNGHIKRLIYWPTHSDSL